MSIVWTKTIKDNNSSFELPPMFPPIVKLLNNHPHFISFEKSIIIILQQYQLEKGKADNLDKKRIVDDKYCRILDKKRNEFFDLFEELCEWCIDDTYKKILEDQIIYWNTKKLPNIRTEYPSELYDEDPIDC